MRTGTLQYYRENRLILHSKERWSGYPPSGLVWSGPSSTRRGSSGNLRAAETANRLETHHCILESRRTQTRRRTRDVHICQPRNVSPRQKHAKPYVPSDMAVQGRGSLSVEPWPQYPIPITGSTIPRATRRKRMVRSRQMTHAPNIIYRG